MSLAYDVVVVGAGVVGLACAARLAARGQRTLVVERHATFGQETSSRNSEVVHAGIYYPEGSLKARLCVAGNRSLYAWCDARGVATARTGKLIVATSAREEPELERIFARATANGVPGLAWVERAELARRYPRLVASRAISSPTTGIVDGHGLMASLAAAARDGGADFAYRHALVALAREGAAWRVELRDPTGEPVALRAARVVNAAGLASDAVAALAGIDVDEAGYRLTWVKGSYFRLRAPGLVDTLVYPVPPPDLRGLGVHVTLDLAGGLRLGPDVEVLAARVADYRVPDEARDAFFAAASTYLRGLFLDDLTPDQAGIRPKLLRPGGAVADFVIAEESARGLPGLVSLIGIESPGLTSALEIAREVDARLSA